MFPSLMIAVNNAIISLPPFNPALDLTLTVSRGSPYTWWDVRDMDLSLDWTVMLIIYWINSSWQRIEQYNLATPFDITNMTLSHVMVMPDWSNSAYRNSTVVRFAKNWTMLFYQVSNVTYTYDLTVPYDITNRTNPKSIITTSLWAFDIILDWTKMIWGYVRDWHIYEITMSVARDITTATITKTNSTLWTSFWFAWFSVSSDWKYIYAWHSNGYVWTGSERISRIDLTTPFDITVLTHSWLYFNPWYPYPSAFRYIESQQKWYRGSGWNALKEYDITPTI